MSDWRSRLKIYGLVGLIGGDVLMLLLMGLYQQWIWFTAFSAITLVIVLAELYGYFIDKEHKTISTRYGDWIKKDPIPAFSALGLFLFAMASLAVHLIAYGLKS